MVGVNWVSYRSPVDLRKRISLEYSEIEFNTFDSVCRPLFQEKLNFQRGLRFCACGSFEKVAWLLKTASPMVFDRGFPMGFW